MAEEERNEDEEQEVSEVSQSEENKGKDTSAELKDRLLRLAAEFDNYKKRVAKDISSSEDKGRADIISKLLPTIDEFELAMESMENEKDKGIAMIYSNLMSTLKKTGLKEIDAKGKADPFKHEIMMTREGPSENEIIEVVRKGYTFNGIMLRPASVITSKPKETVEDKKEEKKE